MDVLSERTSSVKRRPASRRSVPKDRAAKSAAEAPVLSREQIQRLAEFRFQLRRFLHFSSAAAEGAGLRAQQYQLLQCVHGMPEGLDPTIANVAARMLLRHNSSVELVDRAIEQGLLRRTPDPRDHRCVWLRVTTLGERLLASLAAYHVQELEVAGPELIRSLRRILQAHTETARKETGEEAHTD
jgi:DNA-binding MarR family transcriptional regulator